MPETTDRLAKVDERPWEEPGSCRMDCAPHRGPFVVLLARVSLVCGLLSFCIGFPSLVGFPLGTAAYWLAARDLSKMRAGEMDPNGRELTERAHRLGNCGMLLNFLCWPGFCLVWAGHPLPLLNALLFRHLGPFGP